MPPGVRVLSGPRVSAPDLAQMHMTPGAMVFKLLFTAARATDFPQDILAGSVAATIRPNTDGTAVNVRLLQIDIAVRDDRAGATGWYFATLAYDQTIAGASPWTKMVPVGLTWGNDPQGAPLQETWINPAAPAYAKAHLGVGGRLNGPVDNQQSACMSCHGTAQAPSLANMFPAGSCVANTAAWFRNLPGTQPFGRFDQRTPACDTALNGITLTGADYSLQLAQTVTEGLDATAPTFNPCTWDAANAPDTARSPGLRGRSAHR